MSARRTLTTLGIGTAFMLVGSPAFADEVPAPQPVCEPGGSGTDGEVPTDPGGDGGGTDGSTGGSDGTETPPEEGGETPPEGGGTDPAPEGDGTDPAPEGGGTDPAPEGGGTEPTPEDGGDPDGKPVEGGGADDTPVEDDGSSGDPADCVVYDVSIAETGAGSAGGAVQKFYSSGGGAGSLSPAALPTTGDPVAALSVVGLALLVGGTSLVLTARRPIRA